MPPLLPAATTTVMPAFTARSTASHSGSSRYGCSTGVPIDMLITLMSYSTRCSMLQSSASTTSLTVPDPSSPSTRKLRRYAPDAMPRNSRVSAVWPTCPAMMPATCVPWP